MRRPSIALALAGLLSLLVAAVASAGGWAQVSTKSVPVDPPAGQETTINLTMLQHGRTPVSWPGLIVIATDAVSGKTVSAKAEATGATGSYVAKLVFPTEGQWTLSFVSNDLVMEGSVPLTVAPPVAAAPPAATSPNQPATAAPPIAPLVVVLLAVGAVLAIGGLGLRARGRSADTPASART